MARRKKKGERVRERRRVFFQEAERIEEEKRKKGMNGLDADGKRLYSHHDEVVQRGEKKIRRETKTRRKQKE